jgi:hypothetical protein
LDQATFYESIKIDEIVKSQKLPPYVIPAKAVIQYFQQVVYRIMPGMTEADFL